MSRPLRPLLDETKYDTIVVGTGLTESIISASLTRIGQKVLVLDPSETYGSQYTTPNLLDFHNSFPSLNPTPENTITTTDSHEEEKKDESKFNHSFSTFEPIELIHEKGELPDRSRFFYFDMHTKFIYSRGDMVKLLVDSGVGGRYLEFRCLNGVLLFTDGKFQQVPCSKGEIFSTKLLSLKEKRFLMKFVKTIQKLAKNLNKKTKKSDDDEEEEEEKDELEELEKKYPTFSSYIGEPKFRMSKRVQDMVKYAVVMLEGENVSISLRKGIERMKIYMQSLGRFGNTGFLYPIYGISELPQSFCRACAVYGGTFVLGRTVKHVLFDEEKKKVRGVVCTRGQELECKNLVMNRQFLYHSKEEKEEKEVKYQSVTLRYLVVTNYFVLHPGMFKESYRSESSYFHYGAIMGIFPPHTFSAKIGEEGETRQNKYVIKFTQMDCSSKVCPKGYYMMSWETRVDVDEEKEGIEMLKECVKKTLEIQKDEEKEEEKKKEETEETEKEGEGEEEEEEKKKKEIVYEMFFKYKILEDSGIPEELEKKNVENLNICSDVSYEYTIDNTVVESRSVFRDITEKMEKKENEEEPKFMPPLPLQEERVDKSAELLGVDQQKIKDEVSKEQKGEENEEKKESEEVVEEKKEKEETKESEESEVMEEKKEEKKEEDKNV